MHRVRGLVVLLEDVVYLLGILLVKLAFAQRITIETLKRLFLTFLKLGQGPLQLINNRIHPGLNHLLNTIIGLLNNFKLGKYALTNLLNIAISRLGFGRLQQLPNGVKLLDFPIKITPD